jgi:hypothetical protein
MKNSYTSTELLTPVLDGGIHNTNFFNGRLLSAEDMVREQQANRLQHRQLGQTIGEGVAYGLEVIEKKDAASPPGTPSRLVRVSAGMAINRLGQTLYLPSDTDVALVRAKEVVAADAGLSSPCTKPDGTDLLSGTGMYILVMAPASGYEGQAPTSGLGADLSARGGCRRRDTVEGVQFRLVEVKLGSLPNITAEMLSDINRCATAIEVGTEKPKNLSLLQNLLAHLCFGTAELAGFVRDPYGRKDGASPFSSYGVVDALRSGKTPVLTDCDVPLGLIYWTTAGIQFVDQWSVRRRPVTSPFSSPWPLLFSERRRAEAEAMFEQFQEQLVDQLSDATLASVKAIDYFRYLPPSGIIPLAGKNGSRGINLVNFTYGLTILDREDFLGQPFPDRIYIVGAKLEPLIRDSLGYPPIDLRSGELIWTYLVRENIQAIDNTASNPSQPYLVFANGQMPFAGDARFDLNRWGYSNFSSATE